MNNILLIDDNREIHNSLRPIAAAHGYSLLSAYDGLSGLSMAQSCGADIIILDVMLPQSNGFALCRKIREAGCDTPVIFLTAKSDIVDKSVGFRAGCDDYLTKPFAAKELLARIRAMTRIHGIHSDCRFRVGNITLDSATYELSSPTGSYKLANKEYQMMELLMRYPKNMISTEQFMQRIWGYDSETDIKVVWVYISYLRKKLEILHANVQIKAARNIGYSLEEKND